MIHQKPKLGKLVYAVPGHKAQTLESNKPFGVLQQDKKLYVQKGYGEKFLRLTYMD